MFCVESSRGFTLMTRYMGPLDGVHGGPKERRTLSGFFRQRDEVGY
jgi:hypothetical protein